MSQGNRFCVSLSLDWGYASRNSFVSVSSGMDKDSKITHDAPSDVRSSFEVTRLEIAFAYWRNSHGLRHRVLLSIGEHLRHFIQS